MKNFTMNRLHNSSVWQIFRMRDRIEMDPIYQREGGIWGEDAQKQLIDTVINGFDVPKLYLHKYPTPIQSGQNTYEYAVIDGKQRLTALWKYIEGKYALSSSFQYLADTSVAATEFTYSDLAKKFPEIKTDFDSYSLDVVTIETGDLELIEEMFSRLNEAMPLNAAEKRNALPGPLSNGVRALSNHVFFLEKLPFNNSRYRHFDLIAKMLLVAHRNAVTDTKKAYIDRFFKEFEKAPAPTIENLVNGVRSTLDALSTVFIDNDGLLRSIGMVMLYFHLFRRAQERNSIRLMDRPQLLQFDERRRLNRATAESDIALADYDLLEFDRFTQSPNDGIALRFRLAVVDEQLYEGKLGFEKHA